MTSLKKLIGVFENSGIFLPLSGNEANYEETLRTSEATNFLA